VLTVSTDDRYFAADADFADETVRLRYLEEVDDPTTQRLIDSLGVAKGWQCLEVGAGGGSIVRWLADRVGADGHVTAADVDLRYLGDLPANTAAVEHDVTMKNFDSEAYDLVHCRNLLVHLRDPRQAIVRMVAALRPGGWLLVEERDVSSIRSVTPDHPAAGGFDSALCAGNEYLRSSGMIECHLGRWLPGLLVELGLVDVENQVANKILRGGELRALFLCKTTGLLSPQFMERGVLTDHQIRARDAAFLDPTFSFLGDSVVSAWGRRTA
jgi:SAM-dependent methyltransferase